MSKTKPGQPTPPSAETDLPEGWVMVRAADVCEVNPRKPALDVLPADAPASFVPMAAVDDYLGAITAPEDRPFGELRAKSYTPFAEGDVLLAKITPCMENGKAAVARGLTNKLGFGSTEFHVFRSMGAIFPEYLYHYIRQQSFRDDAQGHMAGTAGQLRVPADYVKQFLLPLPPLPEQKRIVAKVEALMARVNAAQARLARLPGVLKRFHQSVLAAACSGQLTAEWREDTASSATGAELLQQIAQERQAAQAQSRRSRRRESDEADSSGPVPVTWEVPETWEWAKISDLLHYERSAAYGVLQPGEDLPNGVPFVRVCDLVNGTVDTSQIKRIAPKIDKQYPRTRLQGDEVLVSLVGTIGRIAVAPKAVAGANVARAIGMLPLCPHVLPQYLRFALETPAKNTELVDLAREVARKTLNLGLLKAVTVPLPPEAEQGEIVRRVKALFALADGIEAHVRAATVRAERLPQAILARAFRGELVPTEADLAAKERREYDPASSLLERIAEARKQHKPAPRKRGRGGRNMAKRSTGRQAATKRRSLDEVLREQGNPLTPQRLFDLAGFDERSVDGFYEELRKLVQQGKVRENRPNNKDVTLEAVGI